MGVMITGFLWGFSEATLFFIIPDVLITLIALKSFTKSLKLSILVTIGAVIGGSIMYITGVEHSGRLLEVLETVPAVDVQMIHNVQRDTEDNGLLDMLLGPTKGIPYKLFAAQAYHAGVPYYLFFLVSIPARIGRFMITAFIASFFANFIFKSVPYKIKVSVWSLTWIIIYAIYFAKFGF
ncbi:hypothetical protein [Salirhabdus salicampi]|uniref:hypothetical protein n=1 Tax=Salirhabdus salicampi TaxID=476102 RepID=UPI0020C4FD91|nr:hypothetical protein [Salirhabdus salicampi]MCP8616288.1 hypothetical protein [Salirhabdus salicampi]